MTDGAIATIVIGVLTFLQVVYFYQQNRRDKSIARKNKNIEANTEKIIVLEKQFLELKGKLWTEDKLTTTVENAVEAVFLRWELELFKSGTLKQKVAVDER